MKSFAVLLIGILLAPALMLAEDAKRPEEKAAVEKKAEAKAEADPEEKAKQAAETIEALGKVFEVFGAALGGRAMIAEDFAIEEVIAGDLLLDAPVEGGEVAGGDPLEQQFLQQFRQLSKTELNFVRAVCQPDKEQDKKLKAASNTALKVAVKKFAEIQKKLQQGIRAGEQPEWPDPRRLMSDVLLKSIKEAMTEGAAKRYEMELEKRAAARKRAALLNLVAKIDKDLVLTADQRGKLTDAINSNWKDSWCQQLETFMYGDAYMPVLPDAQILPVLSEKQKQIWNGIPKQHHQIWGWAGFGFVQAVEIGEEVGVAVEQAAEVKAVEEKAEEPKKADEKKDESP